jgi:GNAT superfamily N-acetyltransferase
MNGQHRISPRDLRQKHSCAEEIDVCTVNRGFKRSKNFVLTALKTARMTHTVCDFSEIEAMSLYNITLDQSQIDPVAAHAFLSRTYWSPNIPLAIVQRAIAGSLCVAVHCDERQVGFARVVTDRATFAYLADVYVLEEHRGQGLSRKMLEALFAHPDLQGLRRMMLATRDAHELYAKFGFTPLANPSIMMELHRPDVYSPTSK